MNKREAKTIGIVTTTTFHVMAQKLGEQLFETGRLTPESEAKRLAIEWAAELIDEGNIVTMWKTTQHNEAA